MQRNVEIKARLDDFDFVFKIAKELSGQDPEVLIQHDVFYNVNNGRMKMRNFKDTSSTLVFYDRPNMEGPKLSNYQMVHFTSEEKGKSNDIHSLLEKSIGIKGAVIKTRYLFMIGQTRVHLDKVEDLGNFMELEVVLRPEQTVQDGQDVADNLRKKLGIEKQCLIPGAYIDLLLTK